ncbi:endolytic transglycosylase MltG [Candidatus Saccharibacteria bacterium]|nr:endolytic transglycosylase MltG [Candidatus Saccharibacteria bacterium]
MDDRSFGKPKKRKTAKIFIITFVSLLLILIIIAGAAFLWYKQAIMAVDPDCGDKCEEISFTVAENTGGSKIADDLEKAGLIRSSLAFRIYLKLEADNRNLKPGDYQFKKNMSVAQIIHFLNEGVVAKTFRITFLPGGTLMAARERLQNLGYKDEEITEAFNFPYNHELLASKPEGATLEGYIYGETYEFYEGTSVVEILNRTFDEMLKVVKENNLVEKYKAQGLTLHEGITLASIVQREAPSVYTEQQQVAQVFELRLKRGIVLGSDAVIAYRADQINPDRNKSDMSYLNTIPCPWNSRKCAGLPPTPISNPGVNALKAVAEPAEGDYLYFLTGDDGKMYYAHTEAEHRANARQHCKELCQIL